MRAAIFGLKVERSGEVLEVLAKILHRVMAEMLLMHFDDVVMGEVFDVYKSGLNKFGKKVPIGLPPVLCLGGFLGWHLAEMGRSELCL